MHERYGCDCFADDTGLMVDALDGAPGVRSARYAGEQCDPQANMTKLLAEMENVEDRGAHFSTVIALVADGEEHTFEGRVDGSISRSRHGESGFGYDPVFVAGETGLCFAEMSADDKNAVSHRGRAMRKLSEFLGLLSILVMTVLCAMPAGAAQWRLHGSYDGMMERIVDTSEYTYFLGTSQDYEPTDVPRSQYYGILMRYDKKGEEMTVLNSLNLLSANTVRAVEYSFAKKYLVVAYDDGNVDLIYDNGDVYTVPGLKLSESAPSKVINEITIDDAGDVIYVSTDFGYFTINEKNKEVGISRVFNVPVSATALYDGKLWIASGSEIYHGDLTEHSLSNFSSGPSFTNVVRMYALGKRGIVVLHGLRSDMTVSLIEGSNGTYTSRTLVSNASRGVEPFPGGILLCHPNSVSILRTAGKDGLYNVPVDDRGATFGTYNGSDIWMSAKRKGISLKKVPSADGNWAVVKDRFFPNVSSAFMCAYAAYSPQYGMLVRNHSMDYNFNNDASNYFYIPDMLSACKDMNWSRLSATYRSDSKGLTFQNPRGIAIDPKNPDHVYCGSVTNGFLRLDMKNVENSLHFSKRSDHSGGYGHPGFVVAVDEPPANSSWPTRCVFSSPAFDAYGILWFSHLNPQPDKQSVSSDTELWYWLPEDRAATTSADTYRPFRKIVVKDAQISNAPEMLPLTTAANKNLIVLMGNAIRGGITVYDHNGTPGDVSDDRQVKMTEMIDQDGQTLDMVRGSALYEDPLTGLVWLSTGEDIVTFNPKEVFDKPASVRRIKVARNDGTNLADYLLSGVKTNAILSDRSGNKWFATKGAGLMCTSSDGREILGTYTTENSSIPGDIVYAAAYNPDSNSIMVSTDKGLAELFLSGTGAGGDDDVKVYPNPVAPDFFGYVTIDGLENDAMIKIVDVAGNLVKECGLASWGEAKWDVTDMDNKRVAAGVYFILATNGPNADSFVKVGKVLVVN